MLLSMTGQGEATYSSEGISIHVELRSVNNRYLKAVTKVSDSISRFEPQVESILREFLKRGSIQATIRVRLPSKESDYRINSVAIQSYMKQIRDLGEDFSQLNASDFLLLPGVLEQADGSGRDDDQLIPLAKKALVSAIHDLNRMRAAEGESMANQLLKSIDQLDQLVERVRERAPNIVDEYRGRLETKVRKVLAELQVESAPFDVLKEVLLYADKCDIQEELVRLKSHFQQFRKAIGEDESQGRKLDFLIQELFRETNTIGSKGNDSIVSQSVVEMKTIIEQMRELIQNVE